MSLAQVPQPVQNGAGEAERFLLVLDQFEKVFRSYTKSEASGQQSKINAGKKLWIFGDLISLIAKGVTVGDAQRLVDSLNSISKGEKTLQEIEAIAKSFPDNVVEGYSKNLLVESNAFKTFKKEYLKSDQATRRSYFDELSILGVAPSDGQLSNYLWSDTGSENPPRFPMLDFYLLLLKNHPQKQGKKEYSELFISRLGQFFTISIDLACRSSTFEDFDAKMKALTSFEPKRMALPDSQAIGKK